MTPTAARIPGLLPQRRGIGGARREAIDRVKLVLGAGPGGDHVSVEGWALNVSRGGVRAIADASSVEGAEEVLSLSKLLELGRELEVLLGDDAARPARIVWIQEEPDGAIIGLAFSDVVSDSSVPPPPGPQTVDDRHGGPRDSLPDASSGLPDASSGLPDASIAKGGSSRGSDPSGTR